jgi:hypothetical protein
MADGRQLHFRIAMIASAAPAAKRRPGRPKSKGKTVMPSRKCGREAMKEFQEVICNAFAMCKVVMVTRLVERAKSDPATARWLLAELYPDQWGPH